MSAFDLLLVAAPSLPHDDAHRAAADVMEALIDWTEPMPPGELWTWAYVFACARNDNGPALARREERCSHGA